MFSCISFLFCFFFQRTGRQTCTVYQANKVERAACEHTEGTEFNLLNVFFVFLLAQSHVPRDCTFAYRCSAMHPILMVKSCCSAGNGGINKKYDLDSNT